MGNNKRVVCVFLIAVLMTASSAVADEVRPLEFIRSLYAKGYHDLAVEYLTLLKDRQDKGKEEMPRALADIWDLEMAKSLRGAANRAYDAKDADQLSARAQEYLDKFLKEKPNHPEADNALVSFADFIMDGALRNLANAKMVAGADKEQQAKFLLAARRHQRGPAQVPQGLRKELRAASGNYRARLLR